MLSECIYQNGGGGGLGSIDFSAFEILQRNQSISGNSSKDFTIPQKPKMIVVTKLYTNAGVIVYNCENDTQFHWETSNNQVSYQEITAVTDSKITIRNQNSGSVYADIYVMY